MRFAGQRVLVIDDDEVALELLASSIHAAGFEVLRRRRAPQVHEVTKLGVAAVVCDLVMAGMDGERVLSNFHAEPELRDVAFILVSADAARLNEALSRMPWLHCVGKDASFAGLVSTLEKLMSRRVHSVRLRRTDVSSHPPRSHSTPPRDQARLFFFESLRESLRVLRPYLIGGVLGPRAHGEVQKHMRNLREAASSTLLGGSVDEALLLCERLTDAAQRDLEAMELLGACTAWLAEVGASGSFPLSLENAPALRAAKTYLG